MKKLAPTCCALMACLLIGCNGDSSGVVLHFPEDVELTHLPCDPGSVIWMQPFGNVDHGGGNAFFHNGINFGTRANGAFYSSAAGYVTAVDLDKDVGTKYRITIRVSSSVSLDYHFEIYGEAPESQRRENIFVSEGDTVVAGQHIADLIVMEAGLGHVHWIVFVDGEATTCPLDQFSESAAAAFEALYDDPEIEQRPVSRPDLCE